MLKDSGGVKGVPSLRPDVDSEDVIFDCLPIVKFNSVLVSNNLLNSSLDEVSISPFRQRLELDLDLVWLVNGGG